MTLAIFSGSGFYDFSGWNQPLTPQTVDTPEGNVIFQSTTLHGQSVVFLARHGEHHHYLSHQVPHRAHLLACQQLGVKAIIALSVVGVINPQLPLGTLMIPHELYFPGNTLPDGSACTVFTRSGAPERGHLISERHFNAGVSQQLQQAATAQDLAVHHDLNYAYVQGPRFNSRSEIQALAHLDMDILSQTLGPEAVLAGELEIPYAALCFGVDYANGVQSSPTPIEVLNQNLKASKEQFQQVISHTLQHWSEASFEGFVYRFG